MTQLSVIIVNYNVKYFLEQAMRSAIKACSTIDAEIIVIDNNSVDGSVELIETKFMHGAGDQRIPVRLIANKENTGFSKANNQGIAIAQGKYILLLNPDTVVEEDTFEKCIRFMEQHGEAGALGVKMIDGTGQFLQESKRAFPSPEVAFYKAFGLASLFPRSKVFGKYHLGYLDENQTHEVEVLAGAFMLLRREALDKTGLLDEDFFMYGEDIDLSYRIVQAGYKNYYFADTTIIHYKGESTKKASFNYVKMFYTAMKIFTKKHFAGRRADFFITLLNFAIYFRAFIAACMRFVKSIAFPLLDAVCIFAGLVLIKEYWEYYVKFIEGGEYPNTYLLINIPLYISIWLLSIYFSGGYDKNASIPKLIRGIFWGTIIIAAAYGFLPEQYRFSRGMIIAGAAYTTFIILITRSVFQFIRHRNFRFGEQPDKKIIIVGDLSEAMRAQQLLNELQLGKQLVGFVRTGNEKTTSPLELGTVKDLGAISALYQANELIFCAKDISSTDIIRWMVSLGQHMDYKIIPDQSLSIIGSNSKNTAGDLYTVDIELKIAAPEQKRSKRLLDISFALFFLITIPISIWFVKNKSGFLQNIFAVLFNKKTWVGYSGMTKKYAENNLPLSDLPKIKPGVLDPLAAVADNHPDEQTIARINFIYARDFRAANDIGIILRSFRKLGHE